MTEIRRNKCRFLNGLTNTTKLTFYKSFGEEVTFKSYLHRVSGAGTNFLFKLCSGTHRLNEELGNREVEKVSV